MHPPTHSASLELGALLTLVGFGAYHGLNPGMGWLFALALGLQQNKARAVLLALIPITAGHAASIALAAIVILALQAFIQVGTLQTITAVLLVAFGAYKLLNWYRHPRWVGMQVRWHELTGWSFLMAMAHGAGLMVAPVLLGMMSMHHDAAAMNTQGLNATLAVLLHSLGMLVTMAVIALVVYYKLGLKILRQGWINFDLVWAVALLVVGGISFLVSV
jgi:hypothetical protein